VVCRDFQTALSHQLSAQGRQAAAELTLEEPSVRQRLRRQNIDGNINSFPSRTQFLSRMCLKSERFIESLQTNIANLALGKTRLWIQRTIFVLGGGEQFLKKKVLHSKNCSKPNGARGALGKKIEQVLPTIQVLFLLMLR